MLELYCENSKKQNKTICVNRFIEWFWIGWMRMVCDLYLQQLNDSDPFSVRDDWRIVRRRFALWPVADWCWNRRPLRRPTPHRPSPKMPGFYPLIRAHLLHDRMVHPAVWLRLRLIHLVYSWCVLLVTACLLFRCGRMKRICELWSSSVVRARAVCCYCHCSKLVGESSDSSGGGTLIMWSFAVVDMVECTKERMREGEREKFISFFFFHWLWQVVSCDCDWTPNGIKAKYLWPGESGRISPQKIYI